MRWRGLIVVIGRVDSGDNPLRGACNPLVGPICVRRGVWTTCRRSCARTRGGCGRRRGVLMPSRSVHICPQARPQGCAPILWCPGRVTVVTAVHRCVDTCGSWGGCGRARACCPRPHRDCWVHRVVHSLWICGQLGGQRASTRSPAVGTAEEGHSSHRCGQLLWTGSPGRPRPVVGSRGGAGTAV